MGRGCKGLTVKCSGRCSCHDRGSGALMGRRGGTLLQGILLPGRRNGIALEGAAWVREAWGSVRRVHCLIHSGQGDVCV